MGLFGPIDFTLLNVNLKVQQSGVKALSVLYEGHEVEPTHSLRSPRYARVREVACCTATASAACAGSERIVVLHSPATWWLGLGLVRVRVRVRAGARVRARARARVRATLGA